MPKKKDLAKENLKAVIEVLEDKKGKDITIIDLTKKSIMCDYFVLVTATSKTHSQSLEENLKFLLKEKKMYTKSIQGAREASWIVMDYGDIIIHIFTEDRRDFYKLEKLWEK